MIRIHNLNKTYDIPRGNLHVLKDVSLDLPDKGLIFILGKSGSGKTTLLNMLSGLDLPDNGSIEFDNFDVAQMTLRQLDNYRNRDVGIIFQEYNLIDTLSVRANIALALELQGNNKKAIDAAVDEILSFVGLDSLTERRVTELSGGQRQRVAIARAMIKSPKIIFADEPTGNLDSETGKQIFHLLQKTAQTCLVVVVSHDNSAALQYADSIVRVSDGIVQNVAHDAKEDVRFSAIIRNGETEHEIRSFSADELQKILLLEMQKRFAIDVHIEKESSIGNKGSVIKNENKSSPDTICTSLPLRRRIYFARHNLMQRPIRSFLVILLFSVSLFLLMATVHISTFNRNTVIEQYIKQYQISCIYPYYTSSYDNSLCETKVKQLTGGSFLFSELQKTFPNTKQVSSISDFSFSLSEKDFTEEEIFKKNLDKYSLRYYIDTEDSSSQKTLLYGRCTQSSSEIVITDYLASSIFGDECALGKHLIIAEVETDIVGIIKTDYKEYAYSRKALTGKDFEYTNYLGKREYEVVLIHPSFLDEVKKNSKALLLKYADFSCSENDIQFESAPELYYIGTDELNPASVKLLSGNWPQNDNEILVTDSYCYNRLINWQEVIMTEGEEEDWVNKIIGKKFRYRELDSEEYDNYYSDCTLIGDYLPEVTIVGIINTTENSNIDFWYDVVISQTVYKIIREAYWNNLIHCDYGLLIDPNDAHHYVEELTRLDFSIDEPSIETICSFSSILNSASSVMTIIVFSVLCMTVLVLFAYISYSISTNYRQLGILRAIGTSGKDTLSIFVFETGVITFIALALSFVFDFFLMKYANAEFAKSLPIHQFDIIVPNILLCLLTVLITVIVSFIASAIPIWNLSKKTPMDIIRNS